MESQYLAQPKKIRQKQRPRWTVWTTQLFSFNPMALVNPAITDDEWLDTVGEEKQSLFEIHIYTPRLILIWLEHFPKDLQLIKKRLASNAMYDLYQQRSTLINTSTTKADIIKTMLISSGNLNVR